MEFMTYTNGRGEKATTDGLRAWRGEDADDTTILIEALQPLSTIYPKASESDADANAHLIAVDCILGRAPSIQPDDDAERLVFRSVWNTVTELKSEFVLCAEPLAFSNELGVFARNLVYGVKPGTRTAFVMQFTAGSVEKDGQRAVAPLFGFPPSDTPYSLASLRASLALVALKVGGYSKEPFGHSVSIDANGVRTGLADMSGAAALMIALRSRTGWHTEWRAKMPF